MITRFAPTPSGYLHLGNLYNFALTSKLARDSSQSKLWLRIDDADATRMRPEFVEHIFTNLKFLGFSWDAGPSSSADFFAHFSQNLKKYYYFERLARAKTYACDCSRAQIQARTSLAYDGHCEHRGLSFTPKETSLRIVLPTRAHPILWTKDDLPAYLLVSIIDDLEMGTTHIVRGEDLRETSEIQKDIARVLNEPRYEAITYTYHSLLFNPEGNKLSKSMNSENLHNFIAEDKSSEAIWKMLSEALKLPVPIASLDDFIETSLLF